MAPNGHGYLVDGFTNGHASEDASADDGHIQQLWHRYEAVKLNDHVKNLLLKDVLTRYDWLLRKHQAYVDEHKQERELAQQSIDSASHWYGQAMHLQRLLNRDPYILVLIDGDGMIFNDNLLKQGELGGKAAATLFHSRIAEWAKTSVPECPEDTKIVVRVYANIKGLGEACMKAGIIKNTEQVAEFARGFTRGKTLFDFTDVGSGKDRADAKIIETFKLYIYDYHCRQILFGCSHDNGYARLLEQYMDDKEVPTRLTLLEGVPFGKELEVLGLEMKRFDGIFRENKIIVTNGQIDLLTGPRGRVDSHTGLNGASGVFTPRTGTPNSSKLSLTDTAPPSPTTNPNTSAAWVTVASRNAHKPVVDIPRLQAESKDIIKRNKKGQRLDMDLEYDRDEVQRMKKLKSCNQHYIGIGCCHYLAGKEDKCPHNHRYKFSSEDLKWLRVVARETPCKKGHDCDDPKCIYGHRCPFPVATEGTMRGIGCLNGDLCRFPKSMHNMDTVAVKTTRVAGAF